MVLSVTSILYVTKSVQLYIFFTKNLYLFTYFWQHWVFVVAHGLSLVVSSRGAGVANTFVVVCRFLIAVASLTVEHGLEAHGLQELWCGL